VIRDGTSLYKLQSKILHNNKICQLYQSSYAYCVWEGIIAGKNITTRVLKTFKPKLYLGSNKLLTYNCKFRN